MTNDTDNTWSLTPLPWQERVWGQFSEARAGGRMPHAVLLAGPEGVGKTTLAESLTGGLLCSRPGSDGQACGECPACRQLLAGSHPDLSILVPEGEGKSIQVDQVREFTRELSLTSQYGARKVGIIRPAEAMTTGAANSLLKTLEEPASDTVIILVSAHPGRLLATIRSRCQQVTLPSPSREAAIQWLGQRLEDADQALLLLNLAQGAPLRALELAGAEEQLADRARILDTAAAVMEDRQGAMEAAGKLEKQELTTLVRWLQQWFRDLVRLLAAGEEVALINLDREGELKRLARSTSLEAALLIHETLTEGRRGLEQPLNRRLFLEDLFSRMTQAGAKAR